MIEHLDRHTTIGVDIDETLINGRYSRTLQNYIKEHHTTKNFHLITFRVGDQTATLPDEFKKHDVNPDWFKSFTNLGWELNDRYNRFYYPFSDIHNNQKKLARALEYHKVDRKDYDGTLFDLTTWKGKVCSEKGCTILIDDMHTLVRLGCSHYKIDFLDSLTGKLESYYDSPN